MLQIIGWLGCLMLTVKLIEMCYNNTLRDEEGKLPEQLTYFLVMGFFAVPGFALWLLFQGRAAQAGIDEEALRNIADENAQLVTCITEAANAVEELRCYED